MLLAVLIGVVFLFAETAQANFNNYGGDNCFKGGCHSSAISTATNTGLAFYVAAKVNTGTSTELTGPSPYAVSANAGDVVELNFYDNNLMGTGNTSQAFLINLPAPSWLYSPAGENGKGTADSPAGTNFGANWKTSWDAAQSDADSWQFLFTGAAGDPNNVIVETNGTGTAYGAGSTGTTCNDADGASGGDKCDDLDLSLLHGSDIRIQVPGAATTGTYPVTIYGIGHTDGGARAFTSWVVNLNVTTGGDVTPPNVSSTVPAAAATGIALDAPVSIFWDENIDCTTVNTTSITSASPGWTLQTCGTNQAVFSTSGQAAATTYSVNVTTAVTDLAGNPMSAAYPFSYTTGGDVTPPNVSSTVPVDAATGIALDAPVSIFWDENIDCTTVNTTSITSSSPPGWTLQSCGTNQAVFSTSGQAAATTYSVNVTTAVMDLAGNPMSAAYPFSYTTAGAACSYTDPTVTILIASKDITTDGGFTNYTVQVTNNDSAACANASYSLSLSDSNSTNFYPSALAQTTLVNVAPATSAQTSFRVTARAGQPNSVTNDSDVTSAADANHGVVTSAAVTTTINVSGGGCVAAGSYLNSNGDQLISSRR
jgi:hypothetical protein